MVENNKKTTRRHRAWPLILSLLGEAQAPSFIFTVAHQNAPEPRQEAGWEELKSWLSERKSAGLRQLEGAPADLRLAQASGVTGGPGGPGTPPPNRVPVTSTPMPMTTRILVTPPPQVRPSSAAPDVNVPPPSQK